VVDEDVARTIGQKWEEATVSERNGSGKRRTGGLPARKPDDSAQVLLDSGRMAAGSASHPPVPSGTPSLQRHTPLPQNSQIDEHPLANLPTVVSYANANAPGRLVVIGGNDRGREFVLAGRETSVGRGVDNHVILTDIAVSRRHVILLYDGSRYSVRDMGSGNGTLVNGVRITSDTFLRDGDQIEIGNTLIRIEHAAQPAIVQGTPSAPTIMPGQMMSPGYPMPGMPPYPGAPGQPFPPQPPMPMGAGMPMPGYPAPPPPPNVLPLPANPSGEWPNQQQAIAAAGPSAFASPFATPSRGSGVDLKAAQKKKLLLAAGGVLVVGGLVGIIVAIATGGSSGSKAKTSDTVANTKPALDKLVKDIDQPGAETASAAPATTSGGPAASPAPSPSPKPSPSPAVATASPSPEPAKVDKPVAVAKTTPPKKNEPKVDRKPDKPDRPKDKPKVVASRDTAPKSTAAAEKAALAAYKGKDFEKAADLLRNAGAKDPAAADRLNVVARDYASVGSNMTKGDASNATAPTAAMYAYQEALKADMRSGKGAHATYLRGQIAKLAPKAAISFMQQGKFEQARQACDAAVNYGVGNDSVILKVRQMLEGKAKEIYNKGVSLEKSSPAEAKNQYRRVLKMVPADSPWYTKAYAALNKPSANNHDDEDE
jgi:hypothetical protein